MNGRLCGWCYKIIPLAYSEALSYAEGVAKLRKKMNEIIDLFNELTARAVFKVNDKTPVDGNVNVGTVTSVNNITPDVNGNVNVSTTTGVSSVNGKTGAVSLDAEDVSALPNNTFIPSKTSELQNDSGFINRALDNTAPADTSTVLQCLEYAENNPFKIFVWAKYNAVTYTPTNSGGYWVYTLYTTYTQTNKYIVFEAQCGDNGEVYRAKSDGTWVKINSDVNSVNGKTGSVTLDASDVGALPSDTPLFSGNYNDLSNKPTIPTKVSDLTNDALFETMGLGTEIPANSDLNNYTTPGVYFVSATVNSATISNAPITDAAYRLEVTYLNNTSRIRQTIYTLGSASASYTRCYMSAGWQPWREFSSLSGLSYSTTGLTGNFTINSGGYCKIGSIVIVAMRISTTANIAAGSALITGFPTPLASAAANILAAASNQTFPLFLSSDGKLNLASASSGGSDITSGKTVIFSCVYLAAN